ncbi:hypothetical protein Ancab_020380 [Ancistrocladus abbreviatus]
MGPSGAGGRGAPPSFSRGGGGGGPSDWTCAIWIREWWRREEGTEEERAEEMMRVILKLREDKCLQSSIEGRRWPWPKKGSTSISPEAIIDLIPSLNYSNCSS